MTESPKVAAPQGLAAALAAFQAELPKIKKTKTAEMKGTTRQGDRYSYSYNYADLADVSEFVLPLMGKHGLSFTCQPTLRDDGKFGLVYQLLHSSGELLDGFYPIDGAMPPQQIGSAITYARRYCLCAVTGVAAEEDDDAQGAQAEAGKPRERLEAQGDYGGPRSDDGLYEGSQGRPEPDPAVQALAELSFLLVGKGAPVADLQAQVYDIAKSHRGWLGVQVNHPEDGRPVPLSAVIREAKGRLEGLAAAGQTSIRDALAASAEGTDG